MSTSANAQTASQAVDSAYFATIADVGLAGLLVVIALWGRLRRARRPVRAAQHRRRVGGALAIIVCILLDGLTRAVFTEFPTMFIGMLLIGLCLAAAGEQSGTARTRR